MFYADDSILMAPSPVALQHYFVYYEYSCEFELKYIKNTACMVVKPKWLNYLNYCVFTLKLASTNVKKYVGCIISDNLYNDREKADLVCLYMPC